MPVPPRIEAVRDVILSITARAKSFPDVDPCLLGRRSERSTWSLHRHLPGQATDDDVLVGEVEGAVSGHSLPA